MASRGNEITGVLMNVTGSGTSSLIIPPKRCRLINLDIALMSTVNLTYWAWVFDVNDSAGILAGIVPSPAMVPIKLVPGEPVSWTPTTKWTPFDNGILILLSEQDDVFTSPIELIDTFNVDYHIVLDDGRDGCCP